MLFGEMLDEERRKGRQEGIKEGIREGEDRLALLMSRMETDGRFTEIPRLWKEPDSRKKMYEQYGI